MRVLFSYIKKELIQALRDRRMSFILFGAPVMQLIIFGYVVTTDIKNISLIVIDHDKSRQSRELASSFFSSGYFTRISRDNISRNTPEQLLQTNQAKVALIIAPGFSKNLERNSPAAIQFLIDGADANSAIITKNYIEEIVRGYSTKLESQHRSGFPLGMLIPEIRVLYNQELKSSNFMVPGLLCLILFNLTAILTAVGITREKELGTLEQILVSPLKRYQFMLGKTIPFVLVGFVDTVLILAVAKILFDVPVRGSLLLLFITAVIFLFTSLGIGLLAAAVSKTQAQAMMTVMPVMMPAFLLSGLFFPVASIPAGLRWLAYINPITYFLIVVRGIMLKGSGLVDLHREIIVLVLFGLFFITFSSLRFRKRLE